MTRLNLTSRMKGWYGSVPTECQECTSPLVDVFYDAPTSNRIWGVICNNCFVKMGRKLGMGRGQKYDIKTLNMLDGWQNVEPADDG